MEKIEYEPRMSDAFMGEMDRCGQVKRKSGKFIPPEKPEALKIENCRAEIQALELNEILPKTLLEEEERFIDTADNKEFIKRYGSGARFCLNLVTVGKDGMPMTKADLAKNKHFKRTEVYRDGLTYNTGLDPGYYFLISPKEIQSDVLQGGCTFTVPLYEQFAYPTRTEKDVVKRSFRQAFLNLKALIDKVPQFAEAA
jgi:hypothetical protein